MADITRGVCTIGIACAALGSAGAVAGPPDAWGSMAAVEAEPFRLRFDPARGDIDLVSPVSLAALQDAQPEDAPVIPDPSSDWRFTFLAQYWLPLKIDGPIEVGPTRTNIDIDLSTILDDLKFIVEGGFELGKDDWTLLVWGVYFNLDTDAKTIQPPLGEFDTSLDFKATIVDIALAYRLADWQLGRSKTATWGLDLLAGIMVWDLDLEVSEKGSFGIDPGIDVDESWVDAIIGGRLVFDFSEKFNVSFRGEVGGFGIGSGSDPVWNVTLMGEYRIAPNIGLAFGYRYLDLDWEQGSGLNRVAYDWTIHGPIIGVNIHF